MPAFAQLFEVVEVRYFKNGHFWYGVIELTYAPNTKFCLSEVTILKVNKVETREAIAKYASRMIGVVVSVPS